MGIGLILYNARSSDSQRLSAIGVEISGSTTVVQVGLDATGEPMLEVRLSGEPCQLYLLTYGTTPKALSREAAALAIVRQCWWDQSKASTLAELEAYMKNWMRDTGVTHALLMNQDSAVVDVNAAAYEALF